jgi:hypothetical protein
MRQAADYARAGSAAYAAGDLASALSGYFRALVRAPSNTSYLHAALSLVGMTHGYVLPAPIRSIFTAAAPAPDFNCQLLVNAVHAALAADPLAEEFRDLAARGGDALEAGLGGARYDAILKDRLLLTVMQRAVIVSAPIEAMLTALRRHALERAAARASTRLLDQHLEFLSALAAQCFNTEYAYAVGGDEEAWLDSILAAGVPRDPSLIVLVGAYRPLQDVVVDLPDDEGTPELALLFRQQIAEPRLERALRAAIPALTPIAAASSARMQAQYEHFPYPRWFAVDYGRPRPFKQVIRERFPGVKFGPLPKLHARVLIPGCGTGRQIAQVPTVFKNPRITAVDLSLTSLAYARRKLDALDVKVHRMGQADVLALGSWEERFDYIECTGVLHHLERPEDGLDVLTMLLQPFGLMRLALYSERARRHVRAARKLIAEHGFPDNAQGVRAARRLIAALPEEDPIHELTTSQDFYSISGLHDLLFNVREHCYTPRGLERLLDGAGLEFLGFDYLDPGVAVRYRDRYPADRMQTDLAAWEDFEREYPDTFTSMYQLWCRRRAERRARTLATRAGGR